MILPAGALPRHNDYNLAGLACSGVLHCEVEMITRRDAIRGGMAALACSAVGMAMPSISAANFDAAQMPVVDTHQHLWDLRRFHLAWIRADDKILHRDFLADDYLRASAGLDVAAAVYMEVDVDPAQRADEAQAVIDLCRQNGSLTVAGVVGGDPADSGFRAYITPLARSPYIKGVRCGYPRGGAHSKAFLAGLDLLGELQMSFDLLVGSDLLDEAARVAAACPKTRMVLDHCGNLPTDLFRSAAADLPSDAAAKRKQWKDGVSRVAENQNVVCRISGVAEGARSDKATTQDMAPIVNHCLDAFGPDRVVFASNWPVCNLGTTFAGWLAAVKAIVANRSEAERRRLFHENAVRFYGLKNIEKRIAQ
jgi:predicted TIM-barrel fold metal-dependent hydrolase